MTASKTAHLEWTQRDIMSPHHEYTGGTFEGPAYGRTPCPVRPAGTETRADVLKQVAKSKGVKKAKCDKEN
jgi:hypothetical protein